MGEVDEVAVSSGIALLQPLSNRGVLLRFDIWLHRELPPSKTR